MRSSRQPLRGFLRMRNSVNAINDFLMLRSAARVRLEARSDADASLVVLRDQFLPSLAALAATGPPAGTAGYTRPTLDCRGRRGCRARREVIYGARASR